MSGIESDVVIGIGEILGIITSVVTIVITYVIERKALVRWRNGLWWALLLHWIGIISIIVGLVISAGYDGTYFVLAGVIIWIFGIMYLIIIFQQICNLETIQFSKPDLSNLPDGKFGDFEISFGAECIDLAIKIAKEKENRKLRFPLILAADESWRPWNISQNFTREALKKGASVIYFTFTRPASQIYIQLAGELTGEAKRDFLKNLIIIDCFTPLALENKKDDRVNGIFYADPRNPHEMNKKYDYALSCSQSKKMCAVYDALSDFLFFTDKEIATQYLRHNMIWEEKSNVYSLYIFRLGTLEELLEQYVLWFANTVISLETEDKKPVMKIRGLLRDPQRYDKINYNLQLSKT
jgi:hypothetical protein